MHHRTELIGGKLEIGPALTGGTILKCIFPNKKISGNKTKQEN
jgi:hypothetical protein